MVGETEVKERPKSNPDYLMQLMNDRKVMSSLPNFSGIFTHLERLLDEGKSPRTPPPPLDPPLEKQLAGSGAGRTHFIGQPSDKRRNSSRGPQETRSTRPPKHVRPPPPLLTTNKHRHQRRC